MSMEYHLAIKRLKARGEGDDREWDGWIASLTQWTWVWVNSASWRWTGKPGMLQSMGSQRVTHYWATELTWTEVMRRDFPGGSVVKNLPTRARDSDLISRIRRSPGEGTGNLLKYSFLGNPVAVGPDRLQSMGSWRVRYDWATKHVMKRKQLCKD